MTALLPVSAGPVSAGPPAMNLLPLKKALAPLEDYGVLRSHSTLRMTGTRSGVSVLLREDLQIVSRRPGRFRALLTQYGVAGRPQKKLVVISNGTSVWTYRPGLREYSVMPFAAFRKADSDIPTLGLVIGNFYLGDGYPLAEGMHSVTPANNDAVLAALGGTGVTLSRETKSMKDQDDYVYSLSLANQDLTYRFYADTLTGRLTRIDLTGTQGVTQFSCREDVESLTVQPPLPAAEFVFTPPPGTVKVLTGPLSPY